ncbi:D-alanyl-D-alanine carboxypeptidase family protein [Nakamurella deserti]|uniref:D-alanyl-D-alanine carboxypeptidase family protein n=1 Tax=Nakamurella deserti TaxID=2164074 RepID=UPI00197B80C7|nr:peptidase M15 [Nakamurella deserti]
MVLLGAAAVPATADEYLPPSETIAPPDTGDCAQRETPPPAVDTSEALPPGVAAPTPLPVPAEPVGGPAMGACGFVLPDGAPAVPSDISATAWMVADLTTGRVLGGKDVHGRYRPASTLKLLTASVLLRNLTDLDATVVGTQEDADQEGSRVGVGDGGIYTVRDLFLGLLLNSGNDTANALARANGGIEATLAEMNALAASIGALDTRAVTVSGLDGAGQQTSAYDLALIMNEALSLPRFTELLSTPDAIFPGFDTYPAFGIANDNMLLAEYEGAVGGKTGFTDDAGNTFVGVAQRNGHRLVVTMLAGTQQPRRQWMQAASLLDWGFAVTAAGLNPVGRLVEPGGDLDASGAASEAAASSSAAATTGPAPVTTPSATPAHTTAAESSPTSGGARSGWWVGLVALLVVAAGAALVLLRRRRPVTVTGAVASGGAGSNDAAPVVGGSAAGGAATGEAGAPAVRADGAAEGVPAPGGGGAGPDGTGGTDDTEGTEGTGTEPEGPGSASR